MIAFNPDSFGFFFVELESDFGEKRIKIIIPNEIILVKVVLGIIGDFHNKKPCIQSFPMWQNVNQWTGMDSDFGKHMQNQSNHSTLHLPTDRRICKFRFVFSASNRIEHVPSGRAVTNDF